jgi:hypothetical protein
LCGDAAPVMLGVHMIDHKLFIKNSIPAWLGLGFIGIVWLNHQLFTNGTISARGAIGIELLYLFVFLGASFWIGVAALWNIRARHLIWFAAAMLSIFAGFYLVSVGLGNGAAVIYAT